MNHYTHSEFLAKRVRELPPQRALPGLVVLPGAAQAVSHDELVAHQADGRSEHEITALVNARWRADNAEVLDGYDVFVQNYNEHKKRLEQEAARAAAEELRKKAVLEELLREHDARST